MKSRTFVDTVVVQVTAGSGGNGCVSFRREKFVPRGGPDGGDGGRGGHVILRASGNVQSLVAFFYSPHLRAADGIPGKGKQLTGRCGGDLVAAVPLGTEVREETTDRLVGDLLAEGQELVVARGGKGGLGNCHWKTATHQAPLEHTDGMPGEEARLRLTLKLIADAGLVGLPNAGKSSLLTALSHAHPRIAAYPFTTLNPIIGTVDFDDYTRVSVADIPGLIRGAHEGVGLGDAFLRHVERAAGLIYVIDMAGADGRDPVDDFADLTNELRLYRADLAERPHLVVANKMDLPAARANLPEFRARTGTDPLPVSAQERQGIDELKQAIRRLCGQTR